VGTMSNSETRPGVSVITPLYNSSPYIEETLGSLRAQTFGDWESILVDDGSTDDTARKVERFLVDARFSYVRQKNQGIAGARNTAIRAARGSWVCLLDHDDRWTADKLEKQLAFADAGGYDLVSTDAFVVRGDSRTLYTELFPRESAEELRRSSRDPSVDLFRLLIRHNFLCASSVLIRRSLFDRCGLLDTRAAPADDHDMWLRCAPEAKVGFLDEPLIEYVVHGNNYSHDRIKMAEREVNVLSKGRRRHAKDGVRARQFDDALVEQYRFLFAELAAAGRYADVASHASRLLKGGAGGLNIALRSGLLRLLTAAPYHKSRAMARGRRSKR
jgi:glycosyltransferase involved in cell wall biosynthesis